MRPEDCRTLADLARFPFTTKADLRDNYPFGMFAVPERDVRRIHASSGTTGRPTVVGYTERDLDTWADVVARSIRAAGGRPGHKVHVAYATGCSPAGSARTTGPSGFGCTVIPASGGMTARQVQLIQDFRPEIIMVTPSYMLTLLDEFEAAGRRPADDLPQGGDLRRGAVDGGDAPGDRGPVRDRRGRHIRALRGDGPRGGAGVRGDEGQGCTSGRTTSNPEVVDPFTGEVLPDGEEGELVFTSLTKEAMPVIRYRTRDLTRLLPGTARTFRRMEKVTGRSDDMVILRGVNLFPTQIEEIVLRTPAVAPHFQLRLTRHGRLDALTVLAEARPDATADEREKAARAIAAGVKDGVGVSVSVEIVDPESLERSVGKIRRIVDLRETGAE
ncbi:AMP-binding protein [Streptomyces sp. CBG30]|uniref:AMP-binding protein n=1 Tax=Streptomyces sp. CBG30 TaxID=2838869 RepID=UPI0035AE54CB